MRIALITHALAAGVGYTGADFAFDPPPRRQIGVPTLAVIGSGKRVGKTAVSGHLARLLADRGDRVVVVAMGRGGPARPELVEGDDGGIGVDELLERSRAGEHAASDFLEDAALARVPAVGARRCGSGLLGTPYMSNVDEAVELALGHEPELIVLEGSGAAVPPIAADRTVLVHSATMGAPGAGFGRYRLLVSDLVVATMCEPPYATPEQLAALETVRPLVRTVLRPVPDMPLAGRRVALFTTAPDPALMAAHLRSEHGADVRAAFGSLSDRDQLQRDLEAAEVAGADVYVTEVKAAGIDLVAAAARERGRDVVLCNNVPQSLEGEPDLDRLLLDLADQAVGRG
jgi:cyclic 2,3-diphosphoglycerate synthetase